MMLFCLGSGWNFGGSEFYVVCFMIIGCLCVISRKWVRFFGRCYGSVLFWLISVGCLGCVMVWV